MKIVKKQKSPVKIVLISLAALLLIGAAGYYAYSLTNPSEDIDKSDEISFDPPTEDQTKAGEEIKKEVIENSSDEDLPAKEDSPASSPDRSTTNPSNTRLDTVLTAKEVHDGTFYLRNEISTLHSDGKCTLTMRNGNKVVTKTSGIQALAKISLCKGFNIPVSELGSGTWSIDLRVQANNRTGNITDSITI